MDPFIDQIPWLFICSCLLSEESEKLLQPWKTTEKQLLEGLASFTCGNLLKYSLLKIEEYIRTGRFGILWTI